MLKKEEKCVREEGGRINSRLSKPLASLRAMRKKPYMRDTKIEHTCERCVRSQRLPSIVAGVHIECRNKEARDMRTNTSKGYKEIIGKKRNQRHKESLRLYAWVDHFRH